MTAITEQWGVTVDEVGILATGRGSDWWVQLSARLEPQGRLVTIDAVPIAGGLYHVPFDSQDDAEFAAEHMGQYVHAKFVKATTLTAARKAVRAHHAKRREHATGADCEYCRTEEAP